MSYYFISTAVRVNAGKLDMENWILTTLWNIYTKLKKKTPLPSTKFKYISTKEF
jgi:hypothetical protein